MQAQQICQLAAQIAKGPGFLSQAGIFLNTILEELYLLRDLQINRVTQSISVTAGTYGPFNLESDYLRTYDLFYPMPSNTSVPGNTGLTMFLNSVTMEQWDAEFKDPSDADYPYEFATDLSPQATGSVGLLYIFPQTSGAITLTHRYMIKRADITSPESSTSTPWFPNNSYLLKELASRLMEITGDDRRKEFHDAAEEMLKPYLIMQGDEQKTVHNIKLDPRHFRTSRALKETKSYPYS